MNRKRRLAILVNTHATRASMLLDAPLEELEASFELTLVRVEDPSAMGQRIREVAPVTDWIAVGSGDGTLARSADALIEAQRPIGVIPLGNANDLARGLGMPLDVAEACRALVSAQPRHVDVGRVNGYYFFNTITLGLGAQVSAQMDRHSKRRWGRWSHFPRLWRAIQKRRSFRVDVVADGTQRVRLHSVHLTVANGRTHGGGLVVAEQARLDDGLLDLSSIRPQSVWRLLALAPVLRSGRRSRHPRLDHLRARRFELATSRALSVTTDGDTMTKTLAVVEVVPRALEMLVPADAATDALAH